MILLGHEKNWALLTTVYPKLSPFLLFHGEKGIGKSLFAKHFSSFVLNKSLIQLENGVCSNYRYFHFDTSEIKIEILPLIKDFLEHRYSEYKILIIDNAGDLNIHASNSLLKLFEKEYEKTFVILIVHNIHKFPTTLRSRFFEIEFTGTMDQQNPLSIYTQGNLGLLKWVEKQGGLNFIEQLKQLMSARTLSVAHDDFIKKYKDDYKMILQLMKIILYLEISSSSSLTPVIASEATRSSLTSDLDCFASNIESFEQLNQFTIRSHHTHIPLEDYLYAGFLMGTKSI